MSSTEAVFPLCTASAQSYQARACGPLCLVELPAVGLLAVFLFCCCFFSLWVSRWPAWNSAAVPCYSGTILVARRTLEYICTCDREFWEYKFMKWEGYNPNLSHAKISILLILTNEIVIAIISPVLPQSISWRSPTHFTHTPHQSHPSHVICVPSPTMLYVYSSSYISLL